MLKTRFIAPCSAETVDELKLAALYFDQVEVLDSFVFTAEVIDDAPIPPEPFNMTGRVTSVLTNVLPSFRMLVAELEREGVVKYVHPHVIPSRAQDRIERVTEHLEQVAWSALFPRAKRVRKGKRKGQVKIWFDAEVARYLNETIATNPRLDTQLLVAVWLDMFRDLILSVADQYPVITPSGILNQFLQNVYRDSEIRKMLKNRLAVIGYAPPVAFNAIKLALPDVSALPFEEILEIRFRFRDELEGFRIYMSELHSDLQDRFEPTYIAAHSAELTENKILPALQDLERRLTDVRSGALRRLLDQIRQPTAYTPLIGTFIHQVPLHLATLASAGLITLAAIADYRRDLGSIRQNGLYYLIQLRRRR